MFRDAVTNVRMEKLVNVTVLGSLGQNDGGNLYSSLMQEHQGAFLSIVKCVSAKYGLHCHGKASLYSSTHTHEYTQMSFSKHLLLL